MYFMQLFTAVSYTHLDVYKRQKKDYLKIIYQGGDNLYVPIDQMDKVQKYIGADAQKVKLNKLGTNEWTKAKAKVQREIEDMTKMCIRDSINIE